MYSIVVKKYGEPDVLEYIKTTSEKIENESVKIKVHSCGVNFADILTIKGRYQERPRPPFSPWPRQPWHARARAPDRASPGPASCARPRFAPSLRPPS